MSPRTTLLRDLARWVTPFDGWQSCATAEALLRAHDSWQTLVVRRGDGSLGAIPRVAFYTELVGPLGYGYALNATRRLDQAMPLDDVLVRDATEPVVTFGEQLLNNGGAGSVEEILVRDGDRVGLVSMRDIYLTLGDRLRRHAAELDHLTRHDSLTGLLNRLGLRAAIASASAVTGDEPASAAVVFADLDRFKVVNDAYGHAAGDRLLCEVANRLRGVARPGHHISRLAGDEFVLLCPGVRDLPTAAEIARSVATVGHAPFDVSGHSVTLSISVGAVLIGPGVDVDDALRSADLAMYEAKVRGSSVHVIRSGDPLSGMTRAHLEVELPRAIREGHIVAHYQPVFRLADRSITGFEALARWTVAGTPVNPLELVSLAERTGLMPDLTDHMIRCSLADMDRLAGIAGGPTRVAVNVSARYAAGRRFVSQVRSALDEASREGRDLVIEITESVAFEQMDEIAFRIDELRALGVEVLLDDFGSGYSSISQVTELPLAGFKVDRSVVQRAHDSPRLRTILAGAFRFAHDYGLRAIAEGLENDADVALVQSLGGELGQGFVCARPLPIDDAERVLRQPVAQRT